MIVLVTGAGVPHILKILFRFQVDVNGDKATPLYKFLKSSKGGLFGDNIKWNFSKFLVDKEGNVVDRYAPTTSPLSIEVQNKSCHYFAKFQVNMILLGRLTIFCLLLVVFAEGCKETVGGCLNQLLMNK